MRHNAMMPVLFIANMGSLWPGILQATRLPSGAFVRASPSATLPFHGTRAMSRASSTNLPTSTWLEVAPPNTYIRPGAADELLECIERDSDEKIRSVMTNMTLEDLKVSMITASSSIERRFRTPLMAAAARGDLEVFSTVVDEFMKITNAAHPSEPYTTIEEQLELKDMDGMHLLMHAATSGNMIIFRMVMSQIPPRKARALVLEEDESSMSFLLHVASAGMGDGVSTVLAPSKLSALARRGAAAFGDSSGGAVDETPDAVFVTQETPDPWVPIVKLAFHFAKRHLYMPEYRRLVTTRDVWGRSVLEHSIRSGRPQVFEAVFDSMRLDIHDDTLEKILDMGDGINDTALNRVLHSQNGKRVSSMFNLISKNLKKDVQVRRQASTVANKIQTFIPASMIVVFQFILPELNKETKQPLYLLSLMCGIAPIWSWGSNMISRDDPETSNRRPRITFMKHLLASPAMFFWGIGTSSIAQNTLGWAETASAAALGVATILIPSIDSFFSGPAARATYAYWFFQFMKVSGRLRKKKSSWARVATCDAWVKPRASEGRKVVEKWFGGKGVQPGHGMEWTDTAAAKDKSRAVCS